MGTMDPRLQELLDHHEIRQVLAAYCHGCDRADEVEMAGVYCEDSWEDHGHRKMSGKDLSIDTVRNALKSTRVVSHQLGQSIIKVHGDEAGVETYFIASLVAPWKDGGEVLRQIGGRYVDTMRRENGAWKIKLRLCVREWSSGHPIADDWAAKSGFIESARGQADVSYQALRMTHSGKILPAASGEPG